MGFLKKLFGRKPKGGENPKVGTADKKPSKSTISKENAARKSNSSSPRVAATQDVFRQASLANTERGSDSSREKRTFQEPVVPGGEVGQVQVLSPSARVLSPRNRVDGMPSSDKQRPAMSPSHDENRNHSNNPHAPPLSHQQLQQFDFHEEALSPRSNGNLNMNTNRPVYSMSADLPQQQINAMDDMNRSDASSSSFNLSTDAEDSEYEQLRRRGVLPTNSSTLNTSAMSAATSPSMYTTDDDRIFPALQTDDDMTQATDPSAKEPSQPPSMLSPLNTPDDEPGRIQIFPSMGNTGTAGDLRAWGVSPPGQGPRTSSSADTNGSSKNHVFTFQGSQKSSALAPNSSSRNAPGAAIRNFTSPRSHASSGSDFSNNDFANFADFSNFPSTTNSGFGDFPTSKPTSPKDVQPSWNDDKASKPSGSPRASDFGNEFGNFEAQTQTPHSHVSSSSGGNQMDTSLSELLAQAKNKRRSTGSRTGSRTGRQSSSSVNSAPAITSAYLRQQHGLNRYSQKNFSESGAQRDNSRGQSMDGTSVSDIIESLEATNQSRLTGRTAFSNRSLGDGGANSTARLAKERMREKRRKEREFNGGVQKSRSSDGSSSGSEDNGETEDAWLFDGVTGALGPKGIAADLESLSGRSNRSKNSQGNKSHKSHKSRSRRSRHGSSRRHQHHKSSEASVDSRGSRTSRNSRYSHRSTRSFLSQMSEQSRSVANDLLRLEMQLAMVGSQENRDDVPARGGGSVSGTSIGGASRTSRTSRKSLTSHHRSHSHTHASSSSLLRRTRVTVIAPKGKLGIILANKADSKGTVVSGVRTSSVLAEKISPGDRIVAIDGEDVSRMTVSEITTIMSRKAEYERTLTVLTTPKNGIASTSMEPAAAGSQHSSPSKNNNSDYQRPQFDNSFSQYRR